MIASPLDCFAHHCDILEIGLSSRQKTDTAERKVLYADWCPSYLLGLLVAACVMERGQIKFLILFYYGCPVSEFQALRPFRRIQELGEI